MLDLRSYANRHIVDLADGLLRTITDEALRHLVGRAVGCANLALFEAKLDFRREGLGAQNANARRVIVVDD